METWVSRGIAPLLPTLVLVVGEWSASLPDRYTPGERAPFTHWIGGWVGPELVCGRRGEVNILDPT
jgi:hypothetical protein